MMVTLTFQLKIRANIQPPEVRGDLDILGREEHNRRRMDTAPPTCVVLGMNLDLKGSRTALCSLGDE